ncbi:hypothetical protein CUPS4123_08135 [Campylobacter upsaliensis]|nr:hypothetical protein [Campylobacter upsaliensis]
MIGDMVLGFVRLVLTVLGIVVGIFYESSMNDFVGLLNGLLTLANWIWWIVDMFLVGKKLRKKNYEKISAVFDNLK